MACGLLHLICKFKWEFRTQGRGSGIRSMWDLENAITAVTSSDSLDRLFPLGHRQMIGVLHLLGGRMMIICHTVRHAGYGSRATARLPEFSSWPSHVLTRALISISRKQGTNSDFQRVVLYELVN